MADNYLEKKMEDLRNAPKRAHSAQASSYHSLNSLLLKNRSVRGFNPSRTISQTELSKIVEVNTKIPSARNQQVLRFRLVAEDEAGLVLPHIRLGGALPQLHLPLPGTEPAAYIIICSIIEENKWVDMDLGIAAQSMLLQAVEMGINGICIGAFDAAALTAAFNLKYKPVLVLALGQSAEHIQLTSIREDENHNYTRKDGLHLVPKVCLEDLILK